MTSNGVGTCGADDNQAQAGHIVAQPLAVRGRQDGAELEIGPEGGPYHCLRAGDGGSSRNQLIAISFHENQRGEITTSDTAGTLKVGGGKPGQGYPAVCVTGDRTHALTSEGADASEDGTGRGTPVVAFDWQTVGSDRTRPNISDKRTSALGVTNRDAVCYTPNPASPLTAGTAASPGVNPPGRRKEDDTNLVATETIVRRLTELECERLQGYPDGWTDGQSGAARYRQLGNSVAVPVVEWIAHRLVAVDESLRETA